jgi:sugar lactone lactonase YvrE
MNQRVRKITNGTITTIAGNSQTGYSGDNGPATMAAMNYPYGVQLDDSGNVYISDLGNNAIRRVDQSGIITTIVGAGGPTTGFTGCVGLGDGGPATSATICTPRKIAVTPSGLYIPESNAIRQVDTSGIISIFAGTRVPGSSDDGGAATVSYLDGSYGLAIDRAGNFAVTEAYRHRVRRIDPTGALATVAGTGIAGYSGDNGPATAAELQDPEDVVYDSSGNLYIADQGGAIRRVDSSGTITTIAGTGVAGTTGNGGPATAAQVQPLGIATDGAGTIYIAEASSSTVRRIDPSGVITRFAGTGTSGFSGDNGPALNAALNTPSGLAVDAAGNVYIADQNNHRIRRVAPNGTISTVAGTGVAGYFGDGGPATAARLYYPFRVTLDSAGNIYVGDSRNSAVRQIDPLGVITTIAGTGTWGFTGDGGPATSALLAAANGIVVASDGVFVTDSYSHVRRIANGTIRTIAGQVDPESMGPLGHARLADARALAAGAQLTLVAGGVSGTVQALRANRPWLETAIGRYPQTPATGALARFRDQSFGTIGGVAYDETAGIIYVAESSANRIHVVTIVDPTDVGTWTIASLANVAGTAGFADGTAATAQFDNPTGLMLDATSRQLYVADTGNNTIRAIDLSSGPAAATVRTIAGQARMRGFAGDGGPALAALLYGPRAIATCPNGDLFIADTNNTRLRRVSAATGTISTVVGDGMLSSFGDGRPSTMMSVDQPLGVACSPLGDVFAASRTTVRMLPADASGVVDGSGDALTIYGALPRNHFPASATSCLTGIAVLAADTVRVVDECAGALIELKRTAAP